MSGGIAFVYDPDSTFLLRVNPEMIDLDRPDDDDLLWLRDRIERHRHETGSVVAEKMLELWSDFGAKFVKVIPKDFKRVFEAERKALADGTDPIDAVMAASRG
jgi:glutamate synthase (NADPH/NADH) large chain